MNRAFIFLVPLLAQPLAAQEGDFQRGLSYYKQGQYQRAIEEFEKIVGEVPDYESGHRVLGDSYLQTGQHQKAIESFQSALRLKGDTYDSYYGLAVAYFNTGKFQEAAAALTKGEEYALSPRDQYRLHQIRGSAYYNLGRFPEAIDELRSAVSVQRGNAPDLLQLGIAYFKIGDDSEAVKWLEQALAVDPNASSAREYLSRIRYREALGLLDQGSYRQSVSLLRTHVNDHPQDGAARFNLGLALLFADDLPAAEEEFRRCASLLPQNWEVHQRLGYIYEKQASYRQALSSYEKAEQLHPDAANRESIERLKERIRRAG